MLTSMRACMSLDRRAAPAAVLSTVQEKKQKPKPPSGWIVVGKVSTALAILGLMVLFVGSQLKPVKSIGKPKQSEAIMLLAK